MDKESKKVMRQESSDQDLGELPVKVILLGYTLYSQEAYKTDGWTVSGKWSYLLFLGQIPLALCSKHGFHVEDNTYSNGLLYEFQSVMTSWSSFSIAFLQWKTIVIAV